MLYGFETCSHNLRVEAFKNPVFRFEKIYNKEWRKIHVKIMICTVHQLLSELLIYEIRMRSHRAITGYRK